MRVKDFKVLTASILIPGLSIRGLAQMAGLPVSVTGRICQRLVRCELLTRDNGYRPTDDGRERWAEIADHPGEAEGYESWRREALTGLTDDGERSGLTRAVLETGIIPRPVRMPRNEEYIDTLEDLYDAIERGLADEFINEL